jgi:uncharacterized protein YukE
MVHLVRGTQENSLTAEKAAELRSAWTGEGARPYTSKQSKSRQLVLTAEC